MSVRGDSQSLSEAIRGPDYLLATYYLELAPGQDVLDRAANFALGQTIGTWVPVPGVTEEMRAKHLGRIVRVLAVPPADLSTQVEDGAQAYFIQVALPVVNFGPQFPMLLTTLLGNDASSSVQAKLVDLELPLEYSRQFPGPRFGIAGVRRLVGVEGRPLLLNMIKPCTGMTVQAGARIFYETALGGVDLIKDDEVLGDPAFSPVVERVQAYEAAGRAAFEETGQRATYVPNVTTEADGLLDNARRAVDAGARAVMVNFAALGYGMLGALARSIDVPILGHYAGSGMFYEGTRSGMSSHIALGKLPRLAGADMVVINTPYGAYPIRREQYLLTVAELALPHPHLAPAFAAVGGGLHPGLVGVLVGELGRDIVLAVGGAIQGHPDGPTAGARAMRQAIDAAVAGVDPDVAARDHPELAGALKQWRVSTRAEVAVR